MATLKNNELLNHAKQINDLKVQEIEYSLTTLKSQLNLSTQRNRDLEALLQEQQKKIDSNLSNENLRLLYQAQRELEDTKAKLSEATESNKEMKLLLAQVWGKYASTENRRPAFKDSNVLSEIKAEIKNIMNSKVDLVKNANSKMAEHEKLLKERSELLGTKLYTLDDPVIKKLDERLAMA